MNIKATEGVNYTRPYIKTRIEDWLANGEDGKPKGNSNSVNKFNIKVKFLIKFNKI